ncbi:MAG: hypothetical protein LQ346_006488 [Caloplaca aetnensis]|nr:MAG: hypothetical protein LQ346_006488 [Caloplaca aetnensis]
MRLLHTETLEFQEFFDSQTPRYAILSHRWTGDEVSFEEFHRYKERSGPIFSKIQKRYRKRNNPSFSKIQKCCNFARNDGYQWVWIDSCCIDKRSSAELTEAINSMYAWYQKSAVCYAYLADVVMVQDEHRKWNASPKDFRQSAWFTRGWTLQELLAPGVLVFLDRAWRVIGSLDRGPSKGGSLIGDISHATGISEYDLWTSGAFACVARKMSWLSRRETTRIEDMAYCVLGLCGVNMPLLYGEGEKAFKRLQLEIIKESDDESIFAWFCDRRGNAMTGVSGILATSPMNFAKSAQVDKALVRRGTRPYSMTNKGLEYHLPRHRDELGRLYSPWDTSSLFLDCGMLGVSPNAVGTVVKIDLVFVFSRWWRDWRQGGQPKLSSKAERDDASRVGSPFETIYISADPTPSF